MAQTWADDEPFGGSGPHGSARPRWRSRWRRPARGGRDHAAEEAALPSFAPMPVDKEAQRRWVVRHIDELPAEAIDEAHRHLLDAQLDDKADQWIAQVHKEFADHVGWLRQLRGRAHGAVREREHLQEAHNQRVAEALAARNAATERLRGEDDEGKWSQPGHSDPTLLSARSRSGADLFYLFAIAIAGVADFIAFYQVLQLVLRNLANQWLILLVIGFTAIALTLAHFLGVFLRDRRAGARWQHPVMLPGCAVLWAALGVMAFFVRWKLSGGSAAPTLPSAGGTLTVPQGNFQGTLPGAAMFAAFYFATGAAAITGSYMAHNPLRRAFARTVRAHESAIKQQAAGARALADAEAQRDAIDHQERAAEEVRDSTIEELRKLADELKKLARLQLTKKVGDVSATDAFLAG
jgi:hypothetical protein